MDCAEENVELLDGVLKSGLESVEFEIGSIRLYQDGAIRSH